MARSTNHIVETIVTDDYTGKPDPKATEITVVLPDGSKVRGDYGTKSAKELQAVLDQFTADLAKFNLSPAKSAGKSDPEAPVIREWAQANGFEVASRGRIHADVVAAYREATAAK